MNVEIQNNLPQEAGDDARLPGPGLRGTGARQASFRIASDEPGGPRECVVADFPSGRKLSIGYTTVWDAPDDFPLGPIEVVVRSLVDGPAPGEDTPPADEPCERCGDVNYPNDARGGSFICGLPSGHQGSHLSLNCGGCAWQDGIGRRLGLEDPFPDGTGARPSEPERGEE